MSTGTCDSTVGFFWKKMSAVISTGSQVVLKVRIPVIGTGQKTHDEMMALAC